MATTYSFTYANGNTTIIGFSPSDYSGSVEIPSGVTSIGMAAFSGCAGITHITNGSGVTSIGEAAFAYCSSLVLISLSSGLTTIGAGAFSGCTSLALTVIPNSVTSIGNNAFESCSALALISLPPNITAIGDYAFIGCSELTVTALPANITSIGISAFEGCTKLALTGLPATVTSIGERAFAYCTTLALTGLPANITTIGDYTFYGCTSLVLASLPSGVTSIGNNAFEGCSDLALTGLPATVTSIGESAFSGCTKLALTSLPPNLTSISNSVFSYCESLVLASLPSGLTSIGNNAFEGCSSLALTSLPSGLTSIGESALSGCSSLALTSLPSGLTSIGNGAFYNCTNIALNSLPSGLTSIGDQVFFNCSSLVLASLPSGLTSIGNQTFLGCTSLRITSLPFGLTSIGAGAFNGCSSLTLTVLPSGLTSIGDQTFVGCTNLAFTSLPSGLTSIGSNAFNGCTNIALGSLPSGLTSIGNGAFYNCSAIAPTTLPSGLTSIGADTFAYCSKLANISFPPGLTTISGVGAFRGCTGLTQITIPSRFTHIASEVFMDCSQLTSLTFEDNGSNKTIYTDAFRRIADGAIAYVPANWSFVDTYHVFEHISIQTPTTVAPLLTTAQLQAQIAAAASPSAKILEMLAISTMPYSSVSSIVTASTHWLLKLKPAGFNALAIYIALSRFSIVELAADDIAIMNAALNTTYSSISLAFASIQPSLTATTIYILRDGTATIPNNTITISGGAVTKVGANNANLAISRAITINGNIGYTMLTLSPFTIVRAAALGTVLSTITTTNLQSTIASPQAAVTLISAAKGVSGASGDPQPNVITAALAFTSRTANTSTPGAIGVNDVYNAMSNNFGNKAVTLSQADSTILVGALSSNAQVAPGLSATAQVTVVIPSVTTVNNVTTGTIPDISVTSGVLYMAVQKNRTATYQIGTSLSTLVVDGSTGQQLIRTPNKTDQILVIGSTVKIYKTSTAFYNYRVWFLGSSVIDTDGVLNTDTTPNPCFLHNAPVLTPSGYRPISSLKAGDLVQTDTGAHVAIQRVSVTTVSASPASNPYRIPKGRFGATKNLAISPNHKVQVDGKMIEARHLGLEVQEMFGTFDYYNLELPDYENMVVAGVTVESLYPLTRITMTASEFHKALSKTYGTITPAAFAAAMKKVHRLADGNFVVPIDKRIYNKKA